MRSLPSVPRWSDPDASMPRELRGAIDTLRSDQPSAAQLERMIAGVSGALGVTPASEPAARIPAPSLAAPWIKLSAILLALAGATWLALHANAPTANLAPAPALERLSAAPAPETPLALPSMQAATEPVLEEQAPKPTRSAARPKRKSTRAITTTTTTEAPQDIGAEIALLRRARRALEHAPREALDLLAQHRRDVAQPAFAEERDAIEIEALLASGEPERAKNAEQAFRTRYPQSAYSRRLNRVLAGER